MDEAEKLFETVKKSPFINSLMKDVAEKAYQQGIDDTVERFMAGYCDLINLHDDMVKYFLKVDLHSEKTDLEKLALSIVSDGMQTVGYYIDQLKEYENAD